MLRCVTICVVIAVYACASDEPPPLPASSVADAAPASETPAPTEPGTGETPPPVDQPVAPTEPWAACGADVGSKNEAVKAAVKACIEGGNYYDRYKGEDAHNKGEDPQSGCTSLSLAKMKCTEEGLQQLTSDGRFKQYKDAKEPGELLDGYLFDQCIDCPEGTDDWACNSTQYNSGTSCVFVKETEDELLRLRIIVPERTSP